MQLSDVLYRTDAALGARVERAVCVHHRRRLARLGWGRALEPDDGPWAEGNPPPRAGNAVEILVDGAEILPRIKGALTEARSHVHIAGWHLEPGFVVPGDGGGVEVTDLLDDVSQHATVRLLLWGGIPLPRPFHPTRSDMRALEERLSELPRITCALDSKERPLHCHHEKAIVIDDRVAFVGGMDLTTLGGNRNDSSRHVPRGAMGWHDLTARLAGPVVRDVADHFAMRWKEVTGRGLRTPEDAGPEGDIDVQLQRTVPENVYRSVPRGDFRILEMYRRGLRSAERLIYLENQFLWSPEIVEVLADKLRHPPRDDFRLVVLVPADPLTGMDDTLGQVAVLLEADDGAGRLLVCTLYAHGASRGHSIYVHAKVGVVDDRWLTLGSANLNEHSLFNDTELNVSFRDPALIRATRQRLWAEHLESSHSEVEGDPTEVVDALLRPAARDQRRRVERGLAPTGRLIELPGASIRSKRLLGPLQGLLVDG